MPPMILRPVVRAWEELGMESAQRLAERTVADLRGARRLFEEDGSFAGHVHSHLFVAAGLTEYGRLTEDGALVEWMDRVFRWIRSQSTSFGLVPELARREDDVIACETCCLMDYIHLALSLTRTGRVEYFDDVERAVRNHLIESRVRSGEWLPTRADATDDEYALRAGLREAVLGAYGGWTGPNHILAYDETLPAGWVKSEEVAGHYLHKVRALQNCCGPSGPKALYLAWQHAARIDGSTLTVNLLLDRALPRAEIRCHEPREGRLTVTLGAPLTLKVRIPEGVPAIEVRAERKGRRLVTQVEGSYLTTVTPLRADDVVNIHYPLREREERITLGNAGFQQYGFRVRWRGSSVVSIEPEEGNASQGRSMLEEEPVRLYYGAEGPHPLYQRGPGWRGDESPAELHSTLGPEVW